MLPLPTIYTKNGYSFSLISREQDVAIYSQTIPEISKLIGYEVFEVQKYPERQINGITIAAKEATPSNEQWGLKGFTIYDLQDARAKVKVLLSNIEKRQNKPTI